MIPAGQQSGQRTTRDVTLVEVKNMGHEAGKGGGWKKGRIDPCLPLNRLKSPPLNPPDGRTLSLSSLRQR